jgi:hypothetical protein
MCWNFIHVDISLNSSFPELGSVLKIQIASQFFMEIIILLCWARNNLIFKGEQPSLASVKQIFLKELNLLKFRVKTG